MHVPFALIKHLTFPGNLFREKHLIAGITFYDFWLQYYHSYEWFLELKLGLQEGNALQLYIEFSFN